MFNLLYALYESSPRRFAERWSARKEGQKARRKALAELNSLKRPEYIVSDEINQLLKTNENK